ncbi:MAG: exodeoxyribonuclease VII small subunit [Candidatus Syntropharchaeia archaeon]
MEELSFEEALKRLETIVQKLEKGGFSLDESLKMFEEGITLFKFCNKKLDEAEHKIEKLVEKEGEIITEPL